MTGNSKNKIRIALDSMGGDFAPVNEIQGAFLAYKEVSNSIDLEIVFVGNEKKINEVIAQTELPRSAYSIIHTDDVITMHDDPVSALRTKQGSSLFVAAKLHSEGKTDAFVSAGNTGAMLSVSTMLLGRIKGVSRPTIGAMMPTISGRPTFVLDVGATIDLRPRFLYEFAVMGSTFLQHSLGIERPTVALLNIGEEETKGTDAIRETYQLLSNSSLNFIGNIEGRDILTGAADVVVCDGFTGNIVLKLAESFINILKSKIKDYSSRSFFNKLKVGMMVPTLKSILSEFDYQEYGGVPLLGVNGVVIIGHGKSSPKAIKNMIIRSIEFSLNNINSKIENALQLT
ncbi:MAG TPA: phosphate acyltransferase PlsX [Candidatus Kapabacteria bacterium]|nr:phosphate acyltransferase PlsX [Candidatus Kapabacteria bacterium]